MAYEEPISDLINMIGLELYCRTILRSLVQDTACSHKSKVEVNIIDNATEFPKAD